MHFDPDVPGGQAASKECPGHILLTNWLLSASTHRRHNFWLQTYPTARSFQNWHLWRVSKNITWIKLHRPRWFLILRVNLGLCMCTLILVTCQVNFWNVKAFSLYTVFRKKHPLTFSSISPWVMCRFKQKLQWIYLRNGRFWPCRN